MTTTIGRVAHRCFVSSRVEVRRRGRRPSRCASSNCRPAARTDAVVGGHDPVAAERGEVDAVVERLAVDDARAPRRRPERQREPAVGQRPAVAGQRSTRRRGGRAGPARRDRGCSGVGVGPAAGRRSRRPGRPGAGRGDRGVAATARRAGRCPGDRPPSSVRAVPGPIAATIDADGRSAMTTAESRRGHERGAIASSDRSR